MPYLNEDGGISQAMTVIRDNAQHSRVIRLTKPSSTVLKFDDEVDPMN